MKDLRRAFIISSHLCEDESTEQIDNNCNTPK